MILDIDAGNSRLKWRLLGDDLRVHQMGVGIDESILIDLHTEFGAEVQRIRVCSVRRRDFADRLTALADDHWKVLPEFAVSSSTCGGVINSYERPETLGVDRWLGMIAAYTRCQTACCVIDAGTAVTLDFVSGAGVHLGGYIVPGLEMQRRSLLGGTEIRLAESADWTALQPGTTTCKAVHNGIVSMLVAWVRNLLPGFADQEWILYLTGGDAYILSSHLNSLDVANVVAPDLVFEGLNQAIP